MKSTDVISKTTKPVTKFFLLVYLDAFSYVCFPFKAHLGQIERIDKHVNHANRVAIVNEVIEAFGQ